MKRFDNDLANVFAMLHPATLPCFNECSRILSVTSKIAVRMPSGWIVPIEPLARSRSCSTRDRACHNPNGRGGGHDTRHPSHAHAHE